MIKILKDNTEKYDVVPGMYFVFYTIGKSNKLKKELIFVDENTSYKELDAELEKLLGDDSVEVFHVVAFQHSPIGNLRD